MTGGPALRRIIAAALLAAALAAAAPAQDQPKTGRVTTGPEYTAGGFHRAMLGSSYRDLWTTPVELPVLDKALEGLPLEQRIAVKSQLSRAGVLD